MNGEASSYLSVDFNVLNPVAYNLAWGEASGMLKNESFRVPRRL
jgi:hypothetical protein